MKYVDEQTIKAEWQNSAATRQEFANDFESFLAYKKADAQGLIKRQVSRNQT